LVPIKKILALFYIYLSIETSEDNQKNESKFEETIFLEDNIRKIDKG
jgi:hypothetical protein